MAEQQKENRDSRLCEDVCRDRKRQMQGAARCAHGGCKVSTHGRPAQASSKGCPASSSPGPRGHLPPARTSLASWPGHSWAPLDGSCGSIVTRPSDWTSADHLGNTSRASQHCLPIVPAPLLPVSEVLTSTPPAICLGRKSINVSMYITLPTSMLWMGQEFLSVK